MIDFSDIYKLYIAGLFIGIVLGGIASSVGLILGKVTSLFGLDNI